MVAVIGKDETAVLHVLMKMGAFLCVELHQLVSADITEGILENVVTSRS